LSLRRAEKDAFSEFFSLKFSRFDEVEMLVEKAVVDLKQEQILMVETSVVEVVVEQQVSLGEIV
jgi:hypothetical protein